MPSYGEKVNDGLQINGEIAAPDKFAIVRRDDDF
jgi:hypothetical protein